MAQIFNSELIVVHIISKPWAEVYGDKVEEVLKSSEADKVVEKMVKEFADKHVIDFPYKIHVAKTFDHTYKGIVEYGESLDVDLIVMSTHGHTGGKRLVLGSVTENVVRRAHCSVIIVRD